MHRDTLRIIPIDALDYKYHFFGGKHSCRIKKSAKGLVQHYLTNYFGERGSSVHRITQKQYEAALFKKNHPKLYSLIKWVRKIIK